MKIKYIFIAFCLACTSWSMGQHAAHSFYYTDSNCNPFGEGQITNWKSSHGSPNIHNQSSAKLVATYSNFQQLTEGIFVNYAFKKTHSYKIEIMCKRATSEFVGLDVLLTDHLSNQYNTDCLGDVSPNNTGDVVFSQTPSTAYSNQYVSISKTITPSKNYGQLWLKSVVKSFFSQEGIIYINEIYITDNGSLDSTPPSVPTNLVVSNITDKTATLSWTSSIDNIGVKEYEIYRNGTSIGKTNSTSYNLTKLTKCTEYQYQVKAIDNYGNSSSKSTLKSIITTSGIANDISLTSEITSKVYTAKAIDFILLEPGFLFDAKDNTDLLTTTLGGGCTAINSVRMALIENEIFDNIDVKEELTKYTSIQLYPNPTVGDVTIQIEGFDTVEGNIIVRNMAGIEVKRTLISDFLSTINISELPNGIYFIEVQVGQTIEIHKVMKI